MEAGFPPAVKAALWYLDMDRLDLQRDRERIVSNILNLGTHEALQWLFATYERSQIASVVQHPRPGEWNRKSLNFWSIIFGIRPEPTSRF